MDKEYAIGIDVGGSSFKCGVISRTGALVHRFLQPLQPENAATEDQVVALLAQAIRQCAAAAPEPVRGVGIGFPGIVEENVVIGGADNLPGFEQLPLAAILEKETGFRVLIDNDANMMGLGEWQFGAAEGCSDVVFLTVGTGIGGALVLHKKLYGGYKNRGAELGHIIIQQDGRPCTCGGKGCLESYASVTALVDQYRLLHPQAGTGVNGAFIVERYRAGEGAAVAALQQHFDALAQGVASLVNIFSPQKVVIGGGISEAGAFYIREIESRVLRMAMPAARQHTQLAAALLGNKAGMLGCAANVFQHF
ncbi:ROK family protein [Paraflavisolibacter sp. H34]|uniref:ROK family protein n=1 Tax=Huijunlia imazamoxiresistens TaxID=3127457 RepID=UPI003016F25E